MKFCTKCGQQLPDDSAFCTQCGASTQAPAPQQTNAPAPQQSSGVQVGNIIKSLLLIGAGIAIIIVTILLALSQI